MTEPHSQIPEGWEQIGDVASNFDHEIDREVEARLREGGCWAGHAAWNFYGRIWFAEGRWHEEPWWYRLPQRVISADTLEELIGVVNTRWGSR